ncbi:MAG TPA: LytTR family DNA-binding domain-containing protein [Fimbriimonadaceae bacterium]|nr:LytTR family DNA-binding domain-containing protein [Fimbriimonadaceae bacterium]
MRALIVDDEALARELLRGMLEHEGVDVVGEAADAEGGVDLAEELSPDVVFLDIRMPGISGVEAASMFNQLEPAPLVILVTGYSDHAVEAFGRSVMDYVLKPVAPERISAALDKARRQLALMRKAKRADGVKRPGRTTLAQRLPIRLKGAIKLVPVEKILYAVTSGKHVIVRTREGEIRTTYTLTQLEAILPSNLMRVHASCIANVAAIDEILLLGEHTYGIRMMTGEELPLGRVQYPRLQERLGFPSVQQAAG